MYRITTNGRVFVVDSKELAKLRQRKIKYQFVLDLAVDSMVEEENHLKK